MITLRPWDCRASVGGTQESDLSQLQSRWGTSRGLGKPSLHPSCRKWGFISIGGFGPNQAGNKPFWKCPQTGNSQKASETSKPFQNTVPKFPGLQLNTDIASGSSSSICTQQLHTVAGGAPKAPWPLCRGCWGHPGKAAQSHSSSAGSAGAPVRPQPSSQCFQTWKSLWSSGSQHSPAFSFTAFGSGSPRPPAGVLSPQALDRELQGRVALSCSRNQARTSQMG